MHKIPLNVLVAILVVLLIMAVAFGNQMLNPPATIPTPNATEELQTNSAATAAEAPPFTLTPFTGQLIKLAWFYKPPQEDQLDLVATNFDFFILTHKDEQARNELKMRGVNVPISQYLLFLVINDPGECDKEPNGNQVAYKPGDFCQISESHPDWFLLDKSGNRILSGKSSYYMDPGNAGYRSFWIERARELQESYGWENIFLDNVEASLSKMTKDGGAVAQYPTDESYQQAVEGFLDYIRRSYFQPQGKPIYANIVSVDEDHVWDRYMQYVDGALVESFATDWSDGYPSLKSWEEEMTQSERALAQGKTLVLVAQGQQQDMELQKFAFASYLLLANGNAYFRYTNSDSYRELWMYDLYNIDLGVPLGNRYPAKNEWRRDFTNGYVTVNPHNHKAEIVLTP